MTSTFSFKMAQEYFIDIFRLKRNAVDGQMNHHAVSCDNNYFLNPELLRFLSFFRYYISNPCNELDSTKFFIRKINKFVLKSKIR